MTDYDDGHDGRVASVTQGTRVQSYEYDGLDRITKRSDTGRATDSYDL